MLLFFASFPFDSGGCAAAGLGAAGSSVEKGLNSLLRRSLFCFFREFVISLLNCVGFSVAVETVIGETVVGFSDDGWADNGSSDDDAAEAGYSRMMYSLAPNLPFLSVV